MEVGSAIVALKKAVAQKPADAIVIQQSRGIRYCSKARVQLLLQYHVNISITQNGDPYENVIAERINEILKTKLIIKTYETIDEASIYIEMYKCL